MKGFVEKKLGGGGGGGGGDWASLVGKEAIFLIMELFLS